MPRLATVMGSTGASLGFVNALLPGRGLSFAIAMVGICLMAMVGAYFTITNRADDGAPILLGCAVGVAMTVLLYYFVLPIFGLEVTPIRGFGLYIFHAAPGVLLLLSAVLAYRLRDSRDGPSEMSRR